MLWAVKRTFLSKLQEVSKTIVCDVYFSKITFCEPLIELGFTIISRLRDDAVLFYTIDKEQRTGKRGRPAKKGKRIDINQLDMNIFKLIYEDKESKVLTAKVYCQSLKREIVVNIIQKGLRFGNGTPAKKCSNLRFTFWKNKAEHSTNHSLAVFLRYIAYSFDIFVSLHPKIS